MGSELRSLILDAVRTHSSAGCSMGELVDTLCARGLKEIDVELAIWEMLRARSLVIHGFVARRLRQRGPAGTLRRSYEFILTEGTP